VEDYREKGVPDEQIVLGLPLYGHRWPTTSTAVPGESTGVASTVTMENAVPEADAAGRCWDAHTLTPYALPSSRSQLWYDDTESVGLKAAWAVEQGLGGFGFWALDYEGADPDFWATIDRVSRLEEGEAGDPGESSDTGAAGGGGGEGGGGGADGGGGGAGADGGCDGADPTGSSDTGAGEGGLGGRYGKGTGCAAAPVALIAGLPLLLGWAARGRRRSA
jgi:GH18 family chitinase